MIKRYGMGCLLGCWLMSPWTVFQWAHGASSEPMAALVALLATTEDETLQRDMLRGLEQAMVGRAQVTMPAGWESVETKLNQSQQPEIRRRVRSLSLVFGSALAMESLRTDLRNTNLPSADRVGMLESLAQVNDPQLPAMLWELMKDNALRADVIRYLARYQQPETPEVLLEGYPTYSALEKQRALSVLASRTSYALPLLQAMADGTLPRTDLSASLIRDLRNLKHDEVDHLLSVVWGAFRDIAADKQGEIERVKRIYYAGGSTPGDATRGRAVFARACQQCHQLFGTGGRVGPDITGSDRANLDYILQNIMDPNAVIPNDYRSSEVETKDGRVLTGVVREQTASSLRLATPTEEYVLPMDQVVSLEQTELSMMPEGLLTPFNDQEIRDLLYYLRQPAQAPLLATRENTDLFFNGRDLTGWNGDDDLWRVEDAEIVGSTTTGLNHNAFLKSEMILKDFRLVFEMKLTPDNENSGIQFRSRAADHGEVRGYQADAGAGWWGKLYEELGRALLWEAPGDQHVKKGEWNLYEILAVGHHVRTAINGHPCVDLQDPEGALQGLVAFQLHSGGPMDVRFRRLSLEVDPEPKLTTTLSDM